MMILLNLLISGETCILIRKPIVVSPTDLTAEAREWAGELMAVRSKLALERPDTHLIGCSGHQPAIAKSRQNGMRGS